MVINLQKISKSDSDLKHWMSVHYSHPKGFVGRQLIYKVYFDDKCYGSIVAGSATLHLPGRDEFGFDKIPLNNLINNTFFHIEGPYPIRNFSQKVLKKFREIVKIDWEKFYGDKVLGFETLVELPRTGEVYLRDSWTLVGKTKGFTCKRISGESSDAWSGKRVWDTKNLKPKLVFMRKI